MKRYKLTVNIETDLPIEFVHLRARRAMEHEFYASPAAGTGPETHIVWVDKTSPVKRWPPSPVIVYAGPLLAVSAALDQHWTAAIFFAALTLLHFGLQLRTYLKGTNWR